MAGEIKHALEKHEEHCSRTSGAGVPCVNKGDSKDWLCSYRQYRFSVALYPKDNGRNLYIQHEATRVINWELITRGVHQKGVITITWDEFFRLSASGRALKSDRQGTVVAYCSIACQMDIRQDAVLSVVVLKNPGRAGDGRNDRDGDYQGKPPDYFLDEGTFDVTREVETGGQ